MAGTTYIRQSTFTDGDVITAALFNNEYNQLENAFVYTTTGTTGHQHDGTNGQGGNIYVIGDQNFYNKIEVDSINNRWGFYVSVGDAAIEQIRIQDGALVPVVDNDIDLGTSSLEFKNLYIDGTANIDTLAADTGTITGDFTVGGNLTVTGNATISGNLTFGDADTDSVSFAADVSSSITPDIDNIYDLGSSLKEWRNLYIDGTANIDSLVADTADINAGSIDNTTIGSTTASTGNFSTLSINGTQITATAAELNTLDGITSNVAELNILDGVTATTAELNLLDGVTATTAELNLLDGVTATTAELNYIDGVTSSVQTQLNAKQPLDAQLTDIAGLTPTDGNFIVGNGTNFVTETPATALASLGVTATATELNVLDGVTATTAEINYLDGVTSNLQTQIDGLLGTDQSLVDILGITHSDGLFIVSNGTNWIGESGNTAIASLGITSTATELNLLDGATVTTTEINYLDGVTSNIQTQLDAKEPADATILKDADIGSSVQAYDSNLTSFVTALDLPTTDGAAGQALITDGAGTVAFGDVDALPAQTGNSGYFLTTDGTDPSWAEVDALPTQTGQAGKYLTTDGTVASWESVTQIAYTRYNYTATASQTVFGATYTAGYVDVFLNGLKLLSGTDFTATNGTTVTLATGATTNDIIEILAYSTASIVSQVKNPDGGFANSVYTAPQSINGGTA